MPFGLINCVHGVADAEEDASIGMGEKVEGVDTVETSLSNDSFFAAQSTSCERWPIN